MTTGSSPAPSASTPPDSQAELLEIRARADRLLANWQRAEADLANLRRRVDTERADLQSSAVAAIAFAILPIADDLERALSQVAEPLKGFTWVDGIWLTYQKLLAILDNLGVKQIQALGQPYDPTRHEAVQELPGEPGKVLHVLQQGYLFRDRVLRAALVVVGKSAGPEQSERGQPASPPAANERASEVH